MKNWAPKSPSSPAAPVPGLYNREGRLYAATRLGVQVFDRNGRSRAILPAPGGSDVIALASAGQDFDMLYIRCADGPIYRRRLKVSGVPPASAPIPLPSWAAG